MVTKIGILSVVIGSDEEIVDVIVEAARIVTEHVEDQNHLYECVKDEYMYFCVNQPETTLIDTMEVV